MYYKEYGLGEIKTNIRVEYECPPIRHLAIQCPNCNEWLRGYDILKKGVQYEYELSFSEIDCPLCGFETKIKPVEVDYDDIYDGVKKKITKWE